MAFALILVSVLTLALFCVTGCTTDERRVVLIPPVTTDPETLEPSDIIRVGPGVRGKVFFPTKDGGWELSGNEIDIPEGWYIIPPPKEKTQK